MMRVMGQWLAKLAIKIVLGWIATIILVGGPLPGWVYRWVEAHSVEEPADRG